MEDSYTSTAQNNKENTNAKSKNRKKKAVNKLRISIEDHKKIGFLLKKLHEKVRMQIKWSKKKDSKYMKEIKIQKLILQIKDLESDILFEENKNLSYKYLNLYYGPIEYNGMKIEKKEYNLPNSV